MATITFEYNPRNKFANALVSLIKSSDEVKVVKAPATKKMTGFEVSMQEIKEGKVNHYDSVEEMFKHLGYEKV